MKQANAIIYFLICFSFVARAQTNNEEPNKIFRISSKAVWEPGMSIMQDIRNECGKKEYPDFGECFLAEAKKAGASADALAFIKMTKNDGYLRDFKETGRVDVAYAFYPFRANENQLCFLVNGSPDMIDVDDYKIMKTFALEKNETYKELKNKYSDISIWPGDRSGTDYPVVNSGTGGGQIFTFVYRLRNGCHACMLLGLVNVDFYFNKDGRYIGSKVVNVIKIKDTNSGEAIENAYTNDSKEIKVKAGKSFSISLSSNRTTGYEWEPANSFNDRIIRLLSKQYLPGNSNLPGSGGTENWNFIALSKGETAVVLEYVRPWEKDKQPAKKIEFKIVVY